MITTFQTSASAGISNLTFTSARVIARSTDAADTGGVTIFGANTTPISGSATLQGRREVVTSSSFTSVNAGRLSAVQAGAVTVFVEGAAAVGSIFLTAQPANNDTVTIGLTGFTQTYTFKTTLTGSANEIFIGAAVGDTATNLKKAINDEGTAATHYGTGTVINPYVAATISGSALALTDKIGCLRSLSWAFAKSGANISVANPVGGTDGTLLITINAGTDAIYSAVSLDDESLAAAGMPALLDWTSNKVRVGGRAFSIHVAAENVTTAMVCSYQYSTEATPTVWRNGSVSVTSLDNNVQIITPPEIVENIRLKINNTNTSAVSVNAKVCYAG